MPKTFGAILKQHDGAGPGFDLLRLWLALAILFSHLATIGEARGIILSGVDLFLHLLGYGPMPVADLGPTAVLSNSRFPIVPSRELGQPIVLSHVPMFFALSGFLVCGSALRTRQVVPFLALRFFRIFPALCVEVVLSAVVIGALFTTLSPREYYESHEFWSYFGNVIGVVQMDLPGVVFSGSGLSQIVNGNLWTLPAEFYSYLILSILIVSGLMFNRAIFSVLFAVATLAVLTANVLFGYNAEPGRLAGDVNVYYFFTGAIVYLWRDRIPYSAALCVFCAVATYFLMLSPHGVYVAPVLLTYVTVFVGLTDFHTSRLLQSGDYSYGIYLYGFPISQTILAMFPGLHGSFFGLLFPAVACTCLFAFLSWHLVEKRFLRLRKRFSPRSAKIAEDLHPELATPAEGTGVREIRSGAEAPRSSAPPLSPPATSCLRPADAGVWRKAAHADREMVRQLDRQPIDHRAFRSVEQGRPR